MVFSNRVLRLFAPMILILSFFTACSSGGSSGGDDDSGNPVVTDDDAAADDAADDSAVADDVADDATDDAADDSDDDSGHWDDDVTDDATDDATDDSADDDTTPTTTTPPTTTTTMMTTTTTVTTTTHVTTTTIATQKDWTFVVYMAADNDLYSFGLGDLEEMKSVGSDDHVNIIVIFDGPINNDSRILYITPGAMTVLANPGEINTGDVETIKQGVTWIFNNYPASHYGLVFWNHGSGWHKDGTPVYKNVAFDYSQSDDLDNTELDEGLAYVRANTGADKIDLIGFDACLMQMAEISYYLRDDGDVMVGSEETEGGDGWEYNEFLADLAATPTMNAATLGTKVVDSYVAIPDATMSVIDLAQMSSVATAATTLATQLVSAGGMGNVKIQNAGNAALSFADYDYVDFYDLCDKLISQNINAGVNSAATSMKTAIAASVLYHDYGYGGYNHEHGMSVYFPLSDYDSAYDDLDWSAATGWNSVID
jgi:hypothetical protein